MQELRATKRDSGKKLGTLRRSGSVPAVLYGPDVEPVALSVGQLDFERVFSESGESSLVRLFVPEEHGERQFVVLIRDVQRDPMRDKPLHLDFHAVRLNEEIKIDVPLVFVGEATIEKRSEGVVLKEIHEIEVEALPEKLPHEIEVDISALQTINQAITIADLPLPQGVRATADSETVVARAAPLVSEAEIAALEAPSEESVEAVEVVGEKKEDEEEPAAEEPETKNAEPSEH